KKASITSLLGRLRSSSGRGHLVTLENHSLPVFARRMETQPEEIIIEILRFLGSLGSSTKSDKGTLSDRSNIVKDWDFNGITMYEIDHLLVQISELEKDNPVCYIFVDYPSHKHNIRGLFHHHVMNRLVDALRQSNRQTRILITAESSLRA